MLECGGTTGMKTVSCARLCSLVSDCAGYQQAVLLCADRYVSSFPKVGIVIPNPANWLLPEFQDLEMTLSTTLSLPDSLLHGAFVTPTSDGLLINMPSCEAPLIPRSCEQVNEM